MEKNVYETYEFLQTTSSDPNSNQFFVLQDDGTILTVHKEIQFITQTEDADVSNLNPTPAEHSTMFINPPQQYYVEFEGNTTELISLNDQYSLATEESNVYENNYILPDSTATPQEMETEEVLDPQKLDAQQMQQLNIEAFNGTKQNTDLTEITLTDEQYQILEQKGWLLLEANNKVFVLNTQGLHDITDNDKLVQRLKSELLQNNTEDDEQLKLKVHNQNGEIEAKDSSNVVEYFIQNNIPVQSIDKTQHYISSDAVDEEINVSVDEPGSPVETPDFAEVPVLNSLNDTEATNELPKKCDAIKIKTKYKFTDIPDKIFLGKTVNGKNLYAKVKMKVTSLAKAVDPLASKKKTFDDSVLNVGMFINLIQSWFRHPQVPTAASVRFAEAVMTQLIRLPNLTDCILQGNLVITKVVTNHTSTGRDIEPPTVVTGFMEMHDDNYVFNHVPTMLRDILQEAEDEQARESSSNPAQKRSKGMIELFHIHVAESKFHDKPPETAIHLSKRKIPIEPLKYAKKRYPNPAIACAVCGAVFQSEAQLKDHQDDECIEVEDSLTIDYAEDSNPVTDNSQASTTSYTVVKNGSDKTYTCTICDTKFTRLFSCKKHIKAHQEGREKKLKVYKCKMCANSYFHPATLSKHILKAHIQKKLNT